MLICHCAKPDTRVAGRRGQFGSEGGYMEISEHLHTLPSVIKKERNQTLVHDIVGKCFPILLVPFSF